jgi:hypothetical protein
MSVVPHPIRALRHGPRKAKVAAGVLAALVVFAAGVVVALIVVRGPISGGGEVVAPLGVEFTGVVVTEDASLMDCNAQVLGAGPGNLLDITIPFAFPDNFCDLTITVRRTGGNASTPLYAQDVVFSSVTTEQFHGGSNGCGAEITPTGTNLGVRLTIPAGALAGPFTAQVDAGLYADDTPDSTGCPST